MATRDDWMRRLGPLYGGAVALVHSTSWRWPVEIGDEARSPGWILALGAPIGLVAWLVAAAARWIGLPPAIAALFGLAMLSMASAGIAERGLADRIERTAAGRGRALGPPTVVALVFVTLVRAAAFVSLAPARWLAVLVATAIAGRWAAVFLQGIGDPILDDDARSLVATPAPLWLVGALSVGALVIEVLALGKVGIAALAIVAALTFMLGLDAQRRERGLSSPIVATAAAIGELVVLLAATI